MEEGFRFVKNYREILSNFQDYLTNEEIEKAIKKSSDGFEYLVSGYNTNLDVLSQDASYDFYSEVEDSQRNQEISIQSIKFISLCKHHLLPFFGSCDIIYCPNKKIIGFSRVVKIIQALSLRMQLQENLTKEIADILIKILEPKSLTVKIHAIHTCMMIDMSGNNGNEITTVENYQSN